MTGAPANVTAALAAGSVEFGRAVPEKSARVTVPEIPVTVIVPVPTPACRRNRRRRNRCSTRSRTRPAAAQGRRTVRCRRSQLGDVATQRVASADLVDRQVRECRHALRVLTVSVPLSVAPDGLLPSAIVTGVGGRLVSVLPNPSCTATRTGASVRPTRAVTGCCTNASITGTPAPPLEAGGPAGIEARHAVDHHTSGVSATTVTPTFACPVTGSTILTGGLTEIWNARSV